MKGRRLFADATIEGGDSEAMLAGLLRCPVNFLNGAEPRLIAVWRRLRSPGNSSDCISPADSAGRYESLIALTTFEPVPDGACHRNIVLPDRADTPQRPYLATRSSIARHLSVQGDPASVSLSKASLLKWSSERTGGTSD